MVTYTLAGGCFWCADAVFRRLKGVISSTCGYSGGTAEDAHYDKVATRTTGHAECVQVVFDEKILPKEVLLDLFFLIHHPTTLNRDGANEGPEYRSAMFYKDEMEKKEFQEAIDRAQPNWDDPIVTSLEPFEAFYEAEPEHQNYFNKNPANGYCSFIIAPKIIKARQVYAKWFKEEE